MTEFGIENLWLDEERMSGNVDQQMMDGIDNSKLVVVFITQRYLLGRTLKLRFSSNLNLKTYMKLKSKSKLNLKSNLKHVLSETANETTK